MPAGRRENTKNPGMAETDKKNQDGAFFKNLRPGGVYKKKTRGIPDRPAANAAAPLQISSSHGGRSSPQKNKRRTPIERAPGTAPRGVRGPFYLEQKKVVRSAMPRHAARRARQVALAADRSPARAQEQRLRACCAVR